MENLKTSSHFKEQFVLICAPDTSKRLVCLMTESCYSYILKEQRVPSLGCKIWPIFQREANNDLYCSLEHVLDPEEKRGYDAMRYFYNSSPKIILQKDKVYVSSRNAWIIWYSMIWIIIASSGLTFGKKKRNFDEIDRHGFGAFAKRNFDEIDRAGFNGFHKRNFDEIDRSGFRGFQKRNFDEIDRSGFNGFMKRNFDEIDRNGFSGFHKRNFDEIDRSGFRGFNKRNFDEIDRSGFRGFSKRNFDEIDRSGFSGFAKRAKKNFDEIDRAGFAGFSRTYWGRWGILNNECKCTEHVTSQISFSIKDSFKIKFLIANHPALHYKVQIGALQRVHKLGKFDSFLPRLGITHQRKFAPVPSVGYQSPS